MDNNEGMELAVSHLKELGHKKIGYLSGALGSHIMQVRHKAFFQAMRQNGLRADSDFAGASYYISQCLEKHLPRLIQMGMTAIICSHDLLANAAMIQCQQFGIRIPDDLSIIGFRRSADLPVHLPADDYRPPGADRDRQMRLLCAGQSEKQCLHRHTVAACQIDGEKFYRTGVGEELRFQGIQK